MKKKKFDIREFEEIARTLKSIAANYPKKSAEYKAIELAAKALIFACERTVAEEFEIFLSEFGKKLSPQQKQHLMKMGLVEADKNGKLESKLNFRKQSEHYSLSHKS
jgi:hypothetical protein